MGEKWLQRVELKRFKGQTRPSRQDRKDFGQLAQQPVTNSHKEHLCMIS
jgi:hypothetical protein